MDQLVKNFLLAVRTPSGSRRGLMGPETKKKALEKLATIMPKIGYPSAWRDYSSLEVKTDSLSKRDAGRGRSKCGIGWVAPRPAGGSNDLGNDDADGKCVLQPDTE